jgi:hypothetical protein
MDSGYPYAAELIFLSLQEVIAAIPHKDFESPAESFALEFLELHVAKMRRF